MKDLNNLFVIVMGDVRSAGICPNMIDNVCPNSRAKKRWGCCKRKNGKFIIEVSVRLLDDHVPDYVVKDVICHEILHTCAGAFNHGPVWRSLAERMNQRGYNIVRAHSPGYDGYPVADESVYKFQCKCEDCGQVVKRMRVSNFTKHLDRYKCGICGGKFVVV